MTAATAATTTAATATDRRLLPPPLPLSLLLFSQHMHRNSNLSSVYAHVEEELLPSTAGMTANGWSGTPPAWPLANDDFALLPLLVHLFSRALVPVQEENLRQVGDEDVAGFKGGRQRLAR